jgi:hypothetical protein
MSAQRFTSVPLSDYLKANDYKITPDRIVTIRPEPGVSIAIKNCKLFDYEFIDRNEGEVLIVDGGVTGIAFNGHKRCDSVMDATIEIPITFLKERVNDTTN